MSDLVRLYRSQDAFERAMQYYDESIASWSIQPQSKFVETRFGTTHILHIGNPSKPAFIFFHGWNGNASGLNIELDLARLTKYFSLYFPDTIGQSGKSKPSRPPTDDASYGLWGNDIVQALNLDRVYLSGISGGGYLALKTALQIPDKLLGMFLIVPGGFVDLSRINIRFVMSGLPAALGFEWGGRFLVRRLVAPSFNDEAMIHAMGEGMQNVISGIKPIFGPKALTDEELSRIMCPVYVVCAKHDIAVAPYKTVARAKKTLTNVQTKIIEDAGHMITIEKRDWLMDEMLSFFGMEHE